MVQGLEYPVWFQGAGLNSMVRGVEPATNGQSIATDFTIFRANYGFHPTLLGRKICFGSRPFSNTPPVGRELHCVEQNQLDIEVEASPTEYAVIGEEITYTFVVTNLGASLGSEVIPASDTIVVRDSLLGTVACEPIQTGGLAVGGSVSCMATYLISHADVVAGSVTNQASAEALFTYSSSVSESIGLVANTPPVANDVNGIQVDEDSLVSFEADASDTNSDPLTIIITSQPENGTAIWNSTTERIEYTPDPDWSGTDTMSYKANDGQDDSNEAIVSIIVHPINDAPVAADDSFALQEDTTLTVLVSQSILGNDSDVEGEPLTAHWLAGPTNGTVTLNPDGSLTYAPDSDFVGSDWFTYQAKDGDAYSQVATVSFTVAGVNDPPSATNDMYTTDEDTELVTSTVSGVLGNDVDVDGDSLSAFVSSGPVNGLLSFNRDGSFVYTPNPDFNGADSFIYSVSDGNGGSATAMVTLTVTPVDDPPVPDVFSLSAPAAIAMPLTLSASDIDSASLSYALVSAPCGTLSGTAPSIVLVPDVSCVGMTVDLIFSVSDSTSTVSWPVSVTILPPPPGEIKIIKTLSTGPLSAGDVYSFEIRQGASASSVGTLVAGGDITGPESSISFPALAPLSSYQVCETEVLPGWSTSLSFEPNSFVPGSDDPEHTNSVVCVSIVLDPAELETITVNNSPPPAVGGTARTIGYWKNHTSCDGQGHQAPVLDETLALAGGSILVGLRQVDRCAIAVDLLDMRKIRKLDKVKDGRKAASDASYRLAAQLLTAELNLVAGAGSCQELDDAVVTGRGLLDEVGFLGTGNYLGRSSTQREQANDLAEVLNQYNNNELCP